MYTQVEKSKENRICASANSIVQKKSGVKQGVGLVDNRPEAIAQKKLQIVSNCSQVKQADQFQPIDETHSVQQLQPIQKKDTLGDIFKNDFDQSTSDPATGNVGGGPGGAVAFIVNDATKPTSNHHIFPKSSLTNSMIKWSRVQNAVHNFNSNMDKVPKDQKGRARTLIDSVTASSKRIGLNADGTVNSLVNYYWNPGNLFVGINSGCRQDDPADTEEKNCPKTMSAGSFQAALTWGRSASKMHTSIASAIIQLIGKDDIDCLINVFLDNALLMAGMANHMHYTSPAIGEDWTLSDSSLSAFSILSRWGGNGHMYKINTGGANVLAGKA